MSKEMDCSEVKSLMARYLAGELDEETRRRVEEHLRDCPDCRQDADPDDELGRVLGESVSDDPPGDYWDDYNDKLRSRVRGAVAMSWRMGCLPGGLLGLIGGGLIWGAIRVWLSFGHGLAGVQPDWLRSLLGIALLVIVGGGLGIIGGLVIMRTTTRGLPEYERDETSLKHTIARNPLCRWTFVSLFMLAHLGVSAFLAFGSMQRLFMPGWVAWPLRVLLFIGLASIIPAYYRWITGYLDGRDVHAEWVRKSIRERLTAQPLSIITALLLLATGIWQVGMSRHERAPSECTYRAEVLFSNGDTRSAVSILKSGIRKYGDRIRILDCYRQLGEIYEETGHPAEARDTYRAGIRAYEHLVAHPKPYDRKQDRLWMLGDAADLYIELGDNKSAFHVSTVRLQMDPDDAENIYFVASDYARAGYKAEAKALYTRMTREFPNNPLAGFAKDDLKRLH